MIKRHGTYSFNFSAINDADAAVNSMKLSMLDYCQVVTQWSKLVQTFEHWIVEYVSYELFNHS